MTGGWSRRRLVVALASLWASGCAARSAPSVPAAPPSKLDPPRVIPSELDVVLRFDLDRLRSGPSALASGARAALGSDSSGGTDAVRRALERADTLWLGFRPGEAVLMADAVWVLRGDFAGFLSGAEWGSASDLGTGWELYERRPDLRSDPGRLYRRLDELCVFVSEAAYDSVERVLEQGAADPTTLLAPSYGLASARARAPALVDALAHRARAAADLLRRAVEISGVIDVRGGFWSASVALDFRHERDAEKTARAVELLARALTEQDARVRPLLSRLHVEVVEATARAELRVAEETLLALIRCWGSEACAG